MHHESKPFRIQPLDVMINLYDEILNAYLERNISIETLTYNKNNSDETETGSTMTCEMIIGDLLEEKNIKEDKKISNVIIVPVSKNVC